jgi:hypothetical protein
MKLCKNCKHILPDSIGNISEMSRCGLERPISLVTGILRAVDTLPFAEIERRTTGRCGLNGEYWEGNDNVMTPEEEEELMKGMPHV